VTPTPNLVIAGAPGERMAIDMRHVVAIAEGPRVHRVFLVNGPEPMPVEAPFDDLVATWRAQCFAR